MSLAANLLQNAAPRLMMLLLGFCETKKLTAELYLTTELSIMTAELFAPEIRKVLLESIEILLGRACLDFINY